VDCLSDSDEILRMKSLHYKLNHLPFDVIGEVIQPIEFLGKVLFVNAELGVFSHIVCKVSHYCLVFDS